MIDILIVEDNAAFRDMLRSTLQSDFPTARISTAAEGMAALRSIGRNKPDLIFMDIRMPGKSGLVLTREIKQRDPDITVAIVTNMDSSEYRDAAFEIGADSFLSKETLRSQDLQDLVGGILARRRTGNAFETWDKR
jgi:DNA-binding NarL/FixJ family response regulator